MKAGGQGEKAWKQELVSRLRSHAPGPGPVSSGSARGRKLRQCPPLMAVLKMAVYVVVFPPPPAPLKHFTHVLVVSCDFWLGGLYLFSK